MNKIHKRKAALVFASFMLIIMIIFSMIMLSSFENTYAETTSSDALLTKLKQMTEDLEIKVNNQTVDITNYSSYLNSRFSWKINIMMYEILRMNGYSK